MASEHCKLKTCEIKAKTTTKGQIISKGLFGVLEFSQKTTFLKKKINFVSQLSKKNIPIPKNAHFNFSWSKILSND